MVTEARAWQRHLLGAALLALGVALPYRNALDNGFVWDDVALVEQDERIRSLDHLEQIFTQDFFEHANERVKYGYYRPLVTLSYLGDHALWGLDAKGFHLTNLVLHWLCCLAVYAFALRVIGVGWEAALAGAGLFALHPVHTESVTWISGRTDVLATLLVLVAWLMHAGAETRTSTLARRGLYSASGAVLFLALLAKELALVLPALLFAFALGRGDRRRALARLVPHGIAIALYGWLRFGVAEVAATPPTDKPWPVHLATLSTAVWRYLAELVSPLPLNAYLQHPWRDPMDVAAWLFAAASVLPVVVLVVLWRLRWLTAFRLALGLGVALLPHAGLLRVSGPPDMGLVMAERFLYLPSVFFCIGVGALAFAWPRARALAWLALALVAVGSGRAVAGRNPDWANDGTLMSTTLRQAPEAALLHSRLGAYQSLRGEHAAAVKSFQIALDLHRRQAGSDSPLLVLDLAAALRRAGDPRTAFALLQPLSQLGYDSPPMLFNLGETLRLLGRSDEARAALASCVEADPSFVVAHLSLSRLEAASGRFEVAWEHQERALVLAPNDEGLRLWAGDLHRMRGDLDAAERMYRGALALDAQFAPAEAALAAVEAERGHSDRAREGFARALRLSPGLHEARVALAVLYAREGDLNAAENELEAVLERAPGNVDALLTQAVLLSHQGKIREARERAADVLSREPGNARAREILGALSPPRPVLAPLLESAR